MAQNNRFALSLRVLTQLALAPDTMHTSAVLAAALKTSPVMVRRVFGPLSKAGILTQRKGPQGGAQLKLAPKAIGFGDIFAAVGGTWPAAGDKTYDALITRSRADALAAMNETTLATLLKKLKKA